MGAVVFSIILSGHGLYQAWKVVEEGNWRLPSLVALMAMVKRVRVAVQRGWKDQSGARTKSIVWASNAKWGLGCFAEPRFA